MCYLLSEGASLSESRTKGVYKSKFRFIIRPLITRKFCICNFGQSITHHILRLLMYRTLSNRSPSTIICDTLTKLLDLLKVDSLGYKNQKLMLWGFGLVPSH